MEPILIQFIQDFISVNQIPFHQVKIPCDDWDWFDCGLRSGLFGDTESLSLLNEWCAAHKGPYLYYWTDHFECTYVFINLPDSDEWLILGPVLYEEIKGSRFDALFRELKLPEKARTPLLTHYYNIKLVLWHSVLESFLTLLADYLYGKEKYQIIYHHSDDLNEWDRRQSRLASGSQIPENPFLNIQFIEDRYEAENLMISAVTSGNEATALACFGQILESMLPQRLSNELRDRKNYTITQNTLIRKAAEAAGVHPYYIDLHSNANIQQIERLTSTDQCKAFQRKIIHGYCQLIKEHSLKDYSMPVRRAMTYINVDLRADLSLKSLASLLNMNASYFSTLFKKETGSTLTDYVNNRRISHARRLLVKTDLSIQDIALQCGISDIYYFSRMFKRISGCTPRAYREKMRFSAPD